MDDYLPAPDIVNVVRQGNFTLYVYAYRTLTREELLICAANWLKQCRRKRFPRKGSAKFITTFGFAD